MSVIDVEEISQKINNNIILDKVSFSVNRGEIFALIGHNGAGKTSLLNIIMGITPIYDGKVIIFEQDDICRARRNIGSVLDSSKLNENSSAIANIRQVSRMLGCMNKKKEIDLLEMVGLEDTGKKHVKTFSFGMKKRLLIACAMIGNPKLLILDEPFNGIDPEGMHDIRLLLQRISKDGTTIIVTSHNISELLKIATNYGILYKGNFLKKYSTVDLPVNSLRKKIIKTEDVKKVISEINQRYPNVYCASETYGKVAVIEEHRAKDIKKIEVYYGMEEVAVTEEDVLLWKMNGY